MDDTLRLQIKAAIVKSLRLTMPPSDITNDIPLFGEGLGLDSIDALELVLELDRTFGAPITDEHAARRILRSVDSIAEFIEERRRGGLGQGTASVA
jgi:acyl carrier protein